MYRIHSQWPVWCFLYSHQQRSRACFLHLLTRENIDISHKNKPLQMVEQKEAIGATPGTGVFKSHWPTSLICLFFIYFHLLSQLFHHCGRKCMPCKELLYSNFHIYLSKSCYFQTSRCDLPGLGPQPPSLSRPLIYSK